ncbi:endoglucanase 24-like [Malania oleifera]|uniref:endoglucanase 24-like n=1 Tax=Malania oleifera TaxID=397392 RepID=UPI0025AE2BBB|nr:endoglucanase 24-like [Malania oleifera]
MELSFLPLLALSLLIFLVPKLPRSQSAGNSTTHDYVDALSKSILFFEGQRSGFLPAEHRMAWRGNSGIADGEDRGFDLIGGYYDAGDNVKFGFPMAFTITMLAWSVVEFGDLMPPAELRNALAAVRWGTDYLLKAVAQPNRIFVQVGDPRQDHGCWERPEDMNTARTVYSVTAPKPASDIAGEMAAALAASSMAFRSSNASYSDTLLKNAIRVFQYADTYRGRYTDDIEVKSGACPFYCSISGYQDELMWGAAWLRRATHNDSYLNYVLKNGQTFGAYYNIFEFGWDNKHAGVKILLSKEFLENGTNSLQPFKELSDSFMCFLMPEAPSPYHIGYTRGGLMHKYGCCNMQTVTTLSFLLLVYAHYLEQAAPPCSAQPGRVTCGNATFGPSALRRLAQSQIDYILGDNPKNMSYVVGYGPIYPRLIHHRGSSLPSIQDHNRTMGCRDGDVYFRSANPNPNVLVGAAVGGPGWDDGYVDDRWNPGQSEPTTYYNAPLVGALAYFAASATVNKSVSC